MKLYNEVLPARFLSRPNRFIALCSNERGELMRCHVKNTGRLRELLLPQAEVYVSVADTPGRKTGFDLVAVRKDGILFNIDSQAPNKVFREALSDGILGFMPEKVLPEQRMGDSRFDFSYECKDRIGYVEVKGVTLFQDSLALFPDAPTERGIKHLEGLSQLAASGIDAHAVFVLQFQGATGFTPNAKTHPRFAESLRMAKEMGVALHAFACEVSPSNMTILWDEVPILL